jgi:hypothetical protein
MSGSRPNTPIRKAGSRAEMPVMPDAAVFTAGAYDQADEAAEIDPYLWAHPDEGRKRQPTARWRRRYIAECLDRLETKVAVG